MDVIYVATPHSFHFDQSAAALRAGKAVLCEKPLTENMETTQALINVAHDTGIYLLEGMWTWFLPAVRKAKEWIGAIRQKF